MTGSVNRRLDFLNAASGYVKSFFVVFFFVGFLGLTVISTRLLFMKLFPLALGLSFIAILLYHREEYFCRTFIILSFTAVAGFFLEVAGVSTHRIFGEYSYGNTLGYKLLETPVMIGINWVMLSYAFGSISDITGWPLPFKILLSATGMVAYDFLLEHVAQVLDMWYWADGGAGLANYVSWFIAGIFFQTFIRLSGLNTRNRVAPFIIAVQAVFLLSLIIYNNLQS